MLRIAVMRNLVRCVNRRDKVQVCVASFCPAFRPLDHNIVFISLHQTTTTVSSVSDSSNTFFRSTGGDLYKGKRAIVALVYLWICEKCSNANHRTTYSLYQFESRTSWRPVYVFEIQCTIISLRYRRLTGWFLLIVDSKIKRGGKGGFLVLVDFEFLGEYFSLLSTEQISQSCWQFTYKTFILKIYHFN